jgi:hypothetical protein
MPVDVCTGVLISPKVVLTAAHACISPFATVCFDKGPITWTIKDNQIQLQGVTSTYDGIPYSNPDFSINLQGKNGAPDFMTHDVAKIVLNGEVPDTVVSKSNYAIIPKSGFLNTLPANTVVELVGYGTQNKQKPENSLPAVLMRNSAQAKIVPANFAWSDEFIRCSANPGQGKGGISYGDSGGPVFLGQSNIVLALNSYVTNPNCVGVTYHSRLDLPDVLKFINEEVTVNG